MSHHRWSRRAGAFAAALLATTASAAWAQGTPVDPPTGDTSPVIDDSPRNDQTTGVQEIIITAQRREENLQRTALAVTAVTAEGLEAQGTTNITELAAIVPNLTATSGAQGSSDANFFVRGVGQFDFIITNDPGVGVYVDDIYLGRTVGALIESADIERVEVLRGPQGTLFGRNTLGGAVRIVTQRPDFDTTAGKFAITGGSRERIDASASVNVPLSSTVAARLFGFTRRQNGYATRISDNEDFGKIDKQGVRGQLLFQPTERFDLLVSADYSADRGSPVPIRNLATAPFPFFPPDVRAGQTDEFFRTDQSNNPNQRNDIWGVSATASYELSDAVTIRSISAYRDLEAFASSDPDGTAFKFYDQDATTDQKQFSQELQLVGSAFNDRLEYLAGLFYYHEEADQALELCFAPISPPLARGQACNFWLQDNDQTTDSYAAFGQGSFAVTDRLGITLGGRYTREDKSILTTQLFDFRPAGSPGGPMFPPPGVPFVATFVEGLRDDLSFEQFTPKLGANYQVADNLFVFASYSKGFRSGGFNGRIIAPTTEVPTFDPDTNDAYEVGFKSDLFDRRLRFNAVGFYSKYKGIQQTISDPVTQFRVANAGDAELYGVEVEATAVPIPRLILNGAFGYTSSSLENVEPAAGFQNGNRLPFSPEFTANAGAEYTLPLGSDFTITPRADYRYQSRVFFSPFNLPLEQQGGYGLLNARVTLATADGGASLAVFAQNLTDEEYFIFGQNALGAQGVAYGYLGRPREFGVTAAFRF